MSNGTQTNTVSYPSIKEIGDKWTKIAIERHQKQMLKFKLKDTGHLYNSIIGKSVALSDKGLHIKFNYALYGKYVDMGVGRGVAVGKRKSEAYARSRTASGKLLRYKRKPKPWYSKVIAKEQVILASIMSNYYSQQAMGIIVNIPKKIEI